VGELGGRHGTILHPTCDRSGGTRPRRLDRAQETHARSVEHRGDLDLAALGPDERDHGRDADVALALGARGQS
jgi:hypothetical protein